MIKLISQILADKLGKSLQVSNNDIAIYTYALEILLGAIFKIVIILAFSAALGIFYTCLVFLSIFFLFRWLGGGVHLDSYWGCVLFGIILVTTMGRISQIKTPLFLLLILFLVTALFSFLVCIIWVPGGTDKKPIGNPLDRKKQKIETLLAWGLWVSVVVICLSHYLFTVSLAAILAVFWSSFFVTPIGYRSIGMIDQLYSNIKGGAEHV